MKSDHCHASPNQPSQISVQSVHRIGLFSASTFTTQKINRLLLAQTKVESNYNYSRQFMQSAVSGGPNAGESISSDSFEIATFPLFWSLIIVLSFQLSESLCSHVFSHKGAPSVKHCRGKWNRVLKIKTAHLWYYLTLVILGVCIRVSDNPVLSNTTQQLCYIFLIMPTRIVGTFTITNRLPYHSQIANRLDYNLVPYHREKVNQHMSLVNPI